MSAVEEYLRGLAAKVDDPPLLDELTDEHFGTPVAVASIARAALLWYLDGRPEAIEARLRDELEHADAYARYRISEASRDVAAGFAELRPDAARHVSHDELQERRARLLRMPVEKLGVA